MNKTDAVAVLRDIARMLDGYASSYDTMARINTDGTVDCASVAADIRQNMADYVRGKIQAAGRAAIQPAVEVPYKAALTALETLRGCAATYVEDHGKDTYPGSQGFRPKDVAAMWAAEIHAIDAKAFLDEAIVDQCAAPISEGSASVAEDAARWRYIKATTTAIRNHETGEREGCTPEQFQRSVDRLRQAEAYVEKQGTSEGSASVVGEYPTFTDTELSDPVFTRAYVEGCIDSFNALMVEVKQLRAERAVGAVVAGSAAEAWKGLVDKAVEVLNRHIVPGGLSDHDALCELYGIFDGQDYRNIADIAQDQCDARQRREMSIDRMSKIAAPKQEAKAEQDSDEDEELSHALRACVEAASHTPEHIERVLGNGEAGELPEPVIAGWGLRHKETGAFGSWLYPDEHRAILAKQADANYSGPYALIIEGAALARTAPASATSAPSDAPDGFALVPLKLTSAMCRILDEDDWQWEDLLAAAEAITEEQYNEIVAAPAPRASIEFGYECGVCVSDKDGGGTISLHYKTIEQAEHAFDVISKGIDTIIKGGGNG